MNKWFAVFLGLFLLLPADARSIHGGIAGPVTFHPTLWFAHGDSVTVGFNAGVGSSYVELVTAALSVTTTNVGAGGTGACDNQISLSIFAYDTGAHTTPALGNSTLYSTAYGINDANNHGAGSYEAVFDLCNEANIAWLAVPDTSKVLAQASAKTGTWANDTSPATGNGVHSSTSGSTLTFSITTAGEPLYIWYGVTDSGSGTFTYNIDGAGAVSVNAFTSPVTGSTTAFVLKRITGVSAGAHSVVLTVTSSGQTIDIWAIGSPPSAPYTGQMRTLVMDVIRQQSDAKAAATLAYSNDVAAEVTLLQGDNLPITLVPARSFVNATTDMSNTLHPNDTGHGHIRDAYLSVFP